MPVSHKVRKIPAGENVYHAAIKRIEWIFDTFSKVCLSFSGGKDSTVLFHLMAGVARKRNLSFSVLFIDWEAQYQCTIGHIQKMKEAYQDVIDTFYWVALPLTTVNGTSQYQPEWICWEHGVSWVRLPPEDAITKSDYFPFYKYAMTFEEFVPEFSLWFSQKKMAAMLIGIRADESLNRFMALTSRSKLRYEEDKPWTTASAEGFYYTAYPLYDWKAKDIWIYHSESKAKQSNI